MPRATTIAATVAAALMLSVVVPACEGLETALDPSPTSSATRSAPSSPPPPPRTGRVLLSVDGDAETVLVFGELSEPARYAGGEGPLSLVWHTRSFDLFTLNGVIRLGAQRTSETLRLQLAADLGDGFVAFTSDDGSCTVTVERAEPRSLAGEVTCTRLTDVDGTLSIDVFGTFEAGGRAA
jgi:hypothetical protein